MLKQHILENSQIPTILGSIGCGHIRHRGNYYSASNPDGDNPSAITVYENDNLTTVNYTRNISQGKKHGTDIFSLVEFVRNCNFFEAIKFVCDCIELDYYTDFEANIPESLKFTKLIMEMQQGVIEQEFEIPLKPISEKILSYYKPYVNDMFLNDGIDYDTQQLFEVGYDEQTNRITIPVRDELGTLVGVKGRLFQDAIAADECKYLYLEPCGRAKILYGLYLTLPFIKQKHMCLVAESEKAVQQMWAMGYKNGCATGGKKVSSAQIEKLTRLCCDLMFLFDKDVSMSELKELADRFVDGVNIYAILDDKGILSEKESPTDNPQKFNKLLKSCIVKIK